MSTLEFYLHGQRYLKDFVIVDCLRAECTIGTSFIRKHNFSIFFSSKGAKISRVDESVQMISPSLGFHKIVLSESGSIAFFRRRFSVVEEEAIAVSVSRLLSEDVVRPFFSLICGSLFGCCCCFF